jgi:23S rRNA (cytosine1962-C5)-methyltransferase
VAVDESAPALAAGEAIAAHHGLRDRIEYRQQDAGKVLQEAGASDGFDLVIVDPPRLSPTRSHRDSALQAYAKLAELGCRATRRGGFVVVCSCSAAIDTALLTRALALGATRANVQALVVERHSQGADHPVMASFPEGLYLKALLAQVVPR